MAYPERIPPEESEAAVGRAIEIEREVKSLQARIAGLRDELSGLAPELEEAVGPKVSLLFCDHRVVVGFRNKVDAKQFREDFPHEEHPYLYNAPSPSAAKIKKELPEELAERYVETRPNLTVHIADQHTSERQ